ncbi:MAG TPA: GspH/FimT family pseudopilin [Candidatus Kryptonia bacterium]|nr:GspH/FimT family pseudopilin [Candidatus Kryptonia bacterium]
MRNGSRGLTLLEVVVALSALAILAGMGVLAYARMVDDVRLNQAARQIVLDLVGTRTRALADNTGRRLVFSVDYDRYQPQVQIGGTYTNDGVPITLPRGIDLIDCTASGAAVTFRPRGNAATFGTIVLRNRPGHERHVVVDIAGRIRIDQ